ncbi:MAG: hypothetical protein IJN51_06315 [Alistipes sp.]|nr:hypothetical protein [Alistipes sp.]
MDSVSKLAERMGGIREYIVNALGSRRAISQCGCLVAIVACIFVAVGCATDKRSAELIAYAEEIAMELPDSALRVVQSIDPESVRGRHDRAQYKLVVAEAHYYRDLIPNRDSIAQPLFDYYIESDNHAERARALYQHALVMQAEGENARAMFSLLEAEKSLSHLDNPRLLGLVHRTMGEIYGAECLFQNALEEYQKSKEYFDKAELPIHSAYATYDIAIIYNRMRDFEAAIKMLLIAEDEFGRLNEYGHMFDTQIELCYNYVQLNDYSNCRNIFNRIKTHNLNTYSLCDYYCISAILSAIDGNLNQAYLLLNRAKQELIINPMQLAYAEYIIIRLQGNDTEALNFHLQMVAEQDKFVFNAINNSLLQSQVDLLSDQVASTKEIQQKTRFINYLLTILSVGIVLIFIYYIKDKQHKHKVEIAQSMAIASELRNILTLKDSEILSQQNIIEQLFASRFDTIDKLSCAYFEAQGFNNEKQRIYREVSSLIDDISSDKKAIKRMEDFVNTYKDNLMLKFRSSIPNATEDDTQLYLYMALGFSPRAISIFMKKSVDAVYNLKSRLRHKIIKSNSQYIEILLGVL